MGSPYAVKHCTALTACRRGGSVQIDTCFGVKPCHTSYSRELWFECGTVWNGTGQPSELSGITVPSRVEVGAGSPLCGKALHGSHGLPPWRLGSSRCLFRRQAVPHELSRELWFERARFERDWAAIGTTQPPFQAVWKWGCGSSPYAAKHCTALTACRRGGSVQVCACFGVKPCHTS